MNRQGSPPGTGRSEVLPSTAILIGGMLVSAGLVLWFGRGLTFSGD